MRAFDSPETGLLLKTSQKIRIPLVLVFTLIAIALLVISKQRYIIFKLELRRQQLSTKKYLDEKSNDCEQLLLSYHCVKFHLCCCIKNTLLNWFLFVTIKKWNDSFLFAFSSNLFQCYRQQARTRDFHKVIDS